MSAVPVTEPTIDPATLEKFKGSMVSVFNAGANLFAVPVNAISDVMSVAAPAPVAHSMRIIGGLFDVATGKTSRQDLLASIPIDQAQEIIKVMSPDQILDMMASENPDWKGATDIIKQDDTLKAALKDALVKDDSFLPGIMEMTKGKNGKDALKFLAEELKNPENRGKLSTVLQDVANRSDVNFAEFQTQTTDMLTKSFMKDIFNHPERIAGMLGSFFDKIGLPGVGEFLAGFAPLIYNGLKAAPGLLKDMVYDENPEAQQFAENYVKPVLDQGRKDIAAYTNNWG